MNRLITPQVANLAGSTHENIEADSDRRFWLGLYYAALAGYCSVILSVAAYVLITPNPPNRGWFAITLAVAVITTVGCYYWRHSVVGKPWRAHFFVVWNLLSFVFLELFCLLDGGQTSWLCYLLLLPMLYLAIGYPLRAVWVCGTLGLISYGVFVWLSPGAVVVPGLLLQSTILLIGWMLALLGAYNRARQAEALHTLRQQLEIRASTDALTQCMNQQTFIAILEQEIDRSERYGHGLSLLLIDIDHFKTVNDTHGHLMGDFVLQQVGSVLRATARDSDHVGRMGGDEFALLAPEIVGPAAQILAKRLRSSLRELALPVDVSLSIGICTADTLTDPADLYHRADEALYAAKRRGRDQIALHREENKSDGISTAMP